MGTIDPQDVHLPDVYVQRIVKAEDMTKRIEFRTTWQGDNKVEKPDPKNVKRDRIVKRAAQELKNGMYVNLGIGIPTLCANYIPEGIEITL